MLSRVEVMFRAAMDMVLESIQPDIDIYEMDKEIDIIELDVRQKVLKHLLLGSNKEDVAVALVLTSAVRDMERIGDYSKSIFEVLDICPTDFIIGGEGADLLIRIKNEILDIFALTEEANRNGDVDKAKLAIEKQLQVTKLCNGIFEYLSLRPSMVTEYAIIYALLSRYLQSVSLHLANVAANVISPFPNVDKDLSES